MLLESISPTCDAESAITKVCGRCHTLVPLAGFNKNAARSDGLSPLCRSCDRERGRAWYAENKDSVRGIIDRKLKRRAGESVGDPRNDRHLPNGQHICKKCKIAKPTQEFHRSDRKGRKYNMAAWCKDCRNTWSVAFRAEHKDRINADARVKSRINYAADPERAKALVKKYRHKSWYGLKDGQFDQILLSQHNSCAICMRQLTGGKDSHVDHDHETGKVRGILCWRCNPALGSFQDSIDTLQRAIEYLRKHR